MAALLPIDTADFLKTMNLDSDIGIDDLVTKHKPSVRLFIKKYAELEYYNDVYLGVLPAANEDRDDSMKLAYCYLMMSYIVEFLNLKTIGKGIIKSTGIDSNKSELLTPDEIMRVKKSLEIQALELIYNYLSSTGIDYYESLTTRKNKTMRITLIG